KCNRFLFWSSCSSKLFILKTIPFLEVVPIGAAKARVVDTNGTKSKFERVILQTILPLAVVVVSIYAVLFLFIISCSAVQAHM
ncbi:MAG: hypothetical protein RR075_05935, partial [Pygmaiobacter sp.]